MTHLYITCENWEGLKGIKEPQIQPKNPSKIPPSPQKSRKKTFFSPLVDNPACELEDRAGHFLKLGPGLWEVIT